MTVTVTAMTVTVTAMMERCLMCNSLIYVMYNLHEFNSPDSCKDTSTKILHNYHMRCVLGGPIPNELHIIALVCSTDCSPIIIKSHQQLYTISRRLYVCRLQAGSWMPFPWIQSRLDDTLLHTVIHSNPTISLTDMYHYVCHWHLTF